MLFFTGQTGSGFIVNGRDHIRSDFKVVSKIVFFFFFFFFYFCIGGW
jgi:hypothetical protein